MKNDNKKSVNAGTAAVTTFYLNLPTFLIVNDN